MHQFHDLATTQKRKIYKRHSHFFSLILMVPRSINTTAANLNVSHPPPTHELIGIGDRPPPSCINHIIQETRKYEEYGSAYDPIYPCKHCTGTNEISIGIETCVGFDISTQFGLDVEKSIFKGFLKTLYNREERTCETKTFDNRYGCVDIFYW